MIYLHQTGSSVLTSQFIFFLRKIVLSPIRIARARPTRIPDPLYSLSPPLRAPDVLGSRHWPRPAKPERRGAPYIHTTARPFLFPVGECLPPPKCMGSVLESVVGSERQLVHRISQLISDQMCIANIGANQRRLTGSLETALARCAGAR